MRVLAAFENEYRIHGEAIARVIRELRPSVEVTVATKAHVASLKSLNLSFPDTYQQNSFP